jgi:hypothetical protein
MCRAANPLACAGQLPQVELATYGMFFGDSLIQKVDV